MIEKVEPRNPLEKVALPGKRLYDRNRLLDPSLSKADMVGTFTPGNQSRYERSPPPTEGISGPTSRRTSMTRRNVDPALVSKSPRSNHFTN